MIKKIFKKMFKSPDYISFKQGMDLTELPVITLYQKDKKFNFLLDTGSNDSIIDKNILDQIEHEPIEEKTSLFGLEGKKREAGMCNITLWYKDTPYEFVYVAHDMKEPFSALKQETGVTLHGLIGSKFFNAYKYVLDFAELVAYSKK